MNYLMMNPAAMMIALKARCEARPFLLATAKPVEAQRRLLEWILRRNRDTEYGRKYKFASLHQIADYRRTVPVVDYEAIRQLVERTARGELNILTTEPPVMFARTSGTTGEPKLIPVTATCRKHSGTAAWLYFVRRDHPQMLAGKLLTIVSPAVEGYTPCGIPFGSTSGMVVQELPKIVQKLYAVPYPVYQIDNYLAEFYTLLRFCLPENITFLGTANPSSVLMLVQLAERCGDALIRDIHDGTLDRQLEIQPDLRTLFESALHPNRARARQLENLRQVRDGRLLPADYWPRLAVIGCWKGGTVSSYIDRFNEWFDPDGTGSMPPVRDMGWLASEARMSIPVSDYGAGGVLAVHRNVFEFVPVSDVDAHPDACDAWTVLGLGDIEVGREYHALVTTTGGLYRYDINDVIEVVDQWRKTPVVTFRRKGRGITNLTGEKICVNQLVEAVARAAQVSGTGVPHFKAAPDARRSLYVLKAEFQATPHADLARRFVAAFDQALGSLNIEWKAKRASGRLGSPLLQVMRHGWYERSKETTVAHGCRIFQSKTIILEAHHGYQPEPGEIAFEVRAEDQRTSMPAIC